MLRHEAEPAVTRHRGSAVGAKRLVGRVGCGRVRLARLAEQDHHCVPERGRGRRGAVGCQVDGGEVGADVLQGAPRSSRVAFRSGVLEGRRPGRSRDYGCCNRAAQQRSRTRTAARRSRPAPSPLTSWAAPSRLPPAGQPRRTSVPARSPEAALRRTSPARMVRRPRGRSRIISPARPATRAASATWASQRKRTGRTRRPCRRWTRLLARTAARHAVRGCRGPGAPRTASRRGRPR